MYTVEQHGTSWRVMLGTAVIHKFGPFVLKQEGRLLYRVGPRNPQALAIEYAEFANRQQAMAEAAGA